MNNALSNHLWQSTLFALAAAGVAFLLRNQRASVRYWIWLAASLKFLVPFSVLILAGGRLHPIERATPKAPPVPYTVAAAAKRISEPFTPPRELVIQSAPVHRNQVIEAVPWIWAAGAGVLLSVWIVQAIRIRRALRASAELTELKLPGVGVRASEHQLEPGIIGIFRPVLLLPRELPKRLTPEQLQSIIDHELCHVRRRDNLTAALHMLSQLLFWFHPLVWWIGSRLVAERERACDEAVLLAGNAPRTYAESILNVCRFCLQSPLPCASGVTGGSELKQRIAGIMSVPVASRMSLPRKAALASAATLVVAVPIFVGALQAQEEYKDSGLRFEVASIKPNKSGSDNSRLGPGPNGGIRGQNVTIQNLILHSYNIRDFQIVNAPAWLEADRWDIVAKPDVPENIDFEKSTPAQRMTHMMRNMERLRALLVERCNLKMHQESKEMPVYALVIGKSGHKMQPGDDSPNQHMRNGRGQMVANGVTLDMITRSLSNYTGRVVVDQTGLKGRFNFQLDFSPETGAGGPPPPPGEGGPSTGIAGSGGSSTPSIFTAVQEQLGLRLESRKAPVPAFVIDKIEKPSEN